MSAPFDLAAFGERAVLITSDRSLLAYADGLRVFGQVRLGLRTALVEGVDPRTAVAEIGHWLDQSLPNKESSTGRVHEIPVHYQGADLDAVANFLGRSTSEVIAAHIDITWQVAMLGFTPGFGYLTSSQPNIFADLPRLESPRARVPAGSVGVVAGMSAIYPSPSPGGWQIIGTADVQLFNPSLDQPSLLAPGDFVKFAAHD